MSCDFGQHEMAFSYHNPYDNPYDNRQVYECSRCGKVTSKDAGPLFSTRVTPSCCSQVQEWFGSSS